MKIILVSPALCTSTVASQSSPAVRGMRYITAEFSGLR